MPNKSHSATAKQQLELFKDAMAGFSVIFDSDDDAEAFMNALRPIVRPPLRYGADVLIEVLEGCRESVSFHLNGVEDRALARSESWSQSSLVGVERGRLASLLYLMDTILAQASS